MAEVGLRISATENVSSIAPKVTDSLRTIAKAGEEIQKALDLGDIEEQYKRFAEREERIYDQQRTRQAEIGTRTPDYQPAVAGRAGLPAISGGVTAALRTGGRTVQVLGAGGDVVGAAPDVLGTLGKTFEGIPAVGKVIAGIAAVAGGIAFAGNALAKQYEKVMEPIMGLTASLGRLGETSEETSRNFGRTMDEVGDKAAEFGMSLEKGIDIFGTLAWVSGVTGEGLGPAAGRVMEYARGFGADPGLLSRYMGMGLRFGQQGNLLGLAAGGLQQAGMGRAQYEEYLQATLKIFEEGLSKGIVKGFEDIELMQTWMAELGDAFKGQYGVGLYQQMSSAFAGATALQREGDVLLYRGAMRALRTEGKPVGVLDIMERMEKGPSKTMMEETVGLIRELTGGKEFDAVQMIKEAFNINTIKARAIWRAREKGGEAMIAALPSGWTAMAETPEVRLLTAQNAIMGEIRDSAKELIPIKAGIVEGAGSIVETLNNLLGIGEEGQAKEQAKRIRLEREVGLQPLAELITTGVRGRPGSPLPAHIAHAADELKRTIAGAAGGGLGQEAALGILEEMMNIPDVMTGSWKGFPEKFVGALLGTEGRPGVMSPYSEGGTRVVAEELNKFLVALRTIVESMDKTVDKAGKLEIGVTEESPTPSSGAGLDVMSW